MKKLKQVIHNFLDWFNGFSFRFFLVIGGWFLFLTVGVLTIVFIFLITISWIFIGEDRSWEEFKEETKIAN